jgi:hypothetical protein
MLLFGCHGPGCLSFTSELSGTPFNNMKQEMPDSNDGAVRLHFGGRIEGSRSLDCLVAEDVKIFEMGTTMSDNMVMFHILSRLLMRVDEQKEGKDDR